jgi:hypothetical protein
MTEETAPAPAPDIDDVLPFTSLDDLPNPEPWYHVIGRKDRYLMKRTMFGKVLLRVREFEHLTDSVPLIWKNIPKVPARVISQAYSYFRWAFASRNAEAMVFLLWKDGEYSLWAPNQNVTLMSVHARFDPRGIPADHRVVGTIHSHCDFGAFHSGTDEGDADDHDGLHITIGHVDKDKPELAGMISFGKTQWQLEPEEYIDGELTAGAFPPEWKAQLHGFRERSEPKKSTTPKAGAIARNGIPLNELDDWMYTGLGWDGSWNGSWKDKTKKSDSNYAKVGGLLSALDLVMERPNADATELALAQALDEEIDLLCARMAEIGLDLDARIYLMRN